MPIPRDFDIETPLERKRYRDLYIEEDLDETLDVEDVDEEETDKHLKKKEKTEVEDID